MTVNNDKIKTASKLCSALTLSGLVEIKEVSVDIYPYQCLSVTWGSEVIGAVQNWEVM